MTEELYGLSIVGCCEQDKYIYAANFEYNCFFRIDKENNCSTEYLMALTGFTNKYAWKIRSMFAIDNKIILISHLGYEIAIYDVDSGEMVYYKPREFVDNIIIRAAIKVKNDIYIFSHCMDNRVFIFSLEDYKYTVVELDYSCIHQRVEKDDVAEVVLDNVCVFDNKIWRPISGTSNIISIDLSNNEVNVVKIDCVEEIFILDFQVDKFVIVPMKCESIVMWNPKTDNLEHIYLDKPINIERGIRRAVLGKEKIILIPLVYPGIMVIDFNGKGIAESSVLSQNHKDDKKSLFIEYLCNDDEIILIPFFSYDMVSYNYRNDQFKYNKINLSKEDYLKNMLDIQGFICEKYKSLSDYILMITDNYEMINKDNIVNNCLKGIIEKI